MVLLGDFFVYKFTYINIQYILNFIECNKILGCHYDTFPPIKIDKNEAVVKFKASNKELLLLDIGKSIKL